MNSRNLFFIFAMMIFLTSCVPAPQPTNLPLTETSSLVTILTKPTTTHFTNEDVGFSFLFPSEYHIIISEDTICLTLAQQDGHPSSCDVANAFIQNRNADGQTLQEIADQIAKQSNPTIPVLRTNIKIGDKNAILLDDVYTYDVLRKAVLIHNGLIVELTFLPWVKSNSEFARIESLYEIVTDSFRFIER